MPDPSSFQTLLEASDNLCAIVDADYRYRWVNAAYQRLHAPSPDSLVGVSVRRVVGDEHFASVTRPRLNRCLDGQPQCYEIERQSAVMGERDLEVRYIPLMHSELGQREIGIVIADITHRRECERELQKMMSIAHLSPSSIAITDLQGRIEYVNPALEKISGYSRDELIGNTSAVLKSGNTPDDVYRNLWETIEGGQTWIGELENRRRDGSLYHEYTLIAPLRDDDGKVVNYAAIKQDTTALRTTESDLERLAFEDSLTGLYTRNGFSQALQEWVDREGWHSEAMVVMVDVIGLRDINDAYGYEGGDRLLIEFSKRLLQTASGPGLAGRIGGDECTLFLAPDPDEPIQTRLEAIVDQLSRPFDLDGVAIGIAIRVGYTRLNHGTRPADTLLREAERALFQHRADSNLPWVAYTDRLEQEARARVDLTRELRTALQDNQLELHFQPKVDLSTGHLVSAEALLRWNHPERGLISPGVFIPIAEQSQLIGPIGEWAVRCACEHLRSWQNEGLDVVRVAVNVSLVQFRSGSFPHTVHRILEETGIAPEQLSLEITESVFAQESAYLLRQMRELRAMNVRLSLDDFGTGYSSLLYLQQYPFDEIKIDQGFVTHLMNDDFSRNIVEAVKMLASALDAEIIAEGIESTTVRDTLLDMGIRLGQGFYYSFPLEAEDFRWLLERGSQLPLTADQIE
ncbi:putative bifunctional diguanylate cyclase/phosphodiesterase [Spiribacter vilamensis]|nr:EAL domain-containing protein [Spiribacter vilamensis]TVO60774.1 EAL domain-containing protein [Spiribacter vilamensis]